MTVSWRPQSFPLLVPPGFSFTGVRRSSGTPCVNQPEGYTQQGVRVPGAKPVLYDAFDEPRDGALHRAADITCAEGTPVVAASAGKVLLTVRVRNSETGRVEERPGAGISPKGGNYVFLERADRFVEYYAHLQSFPKVSPGQQVRAGQLLGYCGRTGNAAGGCPHLHFAVTDPAGQKVNPYHPLKPMYDAGQWQGTPYDPIGWKGLLVLGSLAAAAGYGVFRWWVRR